MKEGNMTSTQRLLNALKPFAAEAAEWERWSKRTSADFHPTGMKFTVADLREAAAAYEAGMAEIERETK